MKERRATLALALILTVAGLACSSGESKVVDQYFDALKANDQNTLTSFAIVELRPEGGRLEDRHRGARR